MAKTKAQQGLWPQLRKEKYIAKDKRVAFGCYICGVKKNIAILVLLFVLAVPASFGQCSLCTKTAQQLGEKPAQGLNSGILYLMMAPFAIVGVIGYRWWKSNK